MSNITEMLNKKPVVQLMKVMNNEELLKKAKSFNLTKKSFKSLLLFGPAKGGKTWAYMPNLDNAVKQGGNVYLICTDSGFGDTFQAYFGDRSEKVAESIEDYMLTDLNQLNVICNDIQSRVIQNKNPNDLIIIDLISLVYDMSARKFIEKSSGATLVDYALTAQKTNEKFGMLDSSAWTYVKQLFNQIINALVMPPLCNIIAVANEKDITLEKVHSKSAIHQYDATGFKPGGSKELAYNFNTVVYINKKGNKHYFQILGHRGVNIDANQKYDYGIDFRQAFNQAVNKQVEKK